MRSRSVRFSLAVPALALLAGCSGGGGGDNNTTTPDATLIIALFEGGGQTATVAQAVATAPAVKVTNAQGAPQSGKSVTFAVTAGAGVLVGATQTTDANGVARVGSWTLGTITGTNTLSATLSGATGSPVSFTATGTAGAVASLSKVAGDAISSAAGVAVATKPGVKAVDAYGNAKAGVAVTFAVATGGGSASGASQTTGSDGVATVGGWTLGTAVGANTMTATAAGTGITNNPATFTVTGIAGPVASLTKAAGENQSAVVSTLLPISPSVRAADQFGNVVASQAVTFAVATGGGSVTGASQTTNASGVATVGGWTLGSVAGTNTLSATAGAYSVTFTATGTASFNATQYAGTYSGTWTNTTFSSTGTGSAVVSVNSGAGTATITVNVTGNVLGAGPVSNDLQNGTYTNNGVSFSGTDARMGNVVATLNANGALTASGTNITSNPTVSRWDATGTLTATSLTMTFTVTFTSGPPAVGTITMTKP